MKQNLFILPIMASALLVVAGCQSKAPQASTTGDSGAAKTPPPAAVSIPAKPAVAVATVPTTAPKAIRINAGGSAVKDAAGVEWLADAGFEGGDVIERPDAAIANTKQPQVYQSEHYSMESFSQALPNGKYQVKLHFCETYDGITGPGERVFSVEVEGKTIKDLDVWAKAGGGLKAYIETVDANVTDGKLDIKFTPNVENPQINAIEIIPVP